jgi:threonine/homoserine/homoserine lactone efflux protein
MRNKRPANNERDLTRVIKYSSALGLGLMAAFLSSIKQVTPEFQYKITVGTGVSFAAAAALSWAFWRLVFGKPDSLEHDLTKPRKRWLIILSAFLTMATLSPFIYALKGVANEKMVEVAEGTALAVLALGGVGFLLWKAARFLENDTKKLNENSKREEQSERKDF